VRPSLVATGRFLLCFLHAGACREPISLTDVLRHVRGGEAIEILESVYLV
jgi:hypothetical protein